MQRREAAPFWVIGHRGAPTVEIENTLASCRQAVERDLANGLEVDVCVTRDGEIPLWHDFDPAHLTARLRRWSLEPDVLYRPTAPSAGRWFQPTAELTLAELREHYGYAKKGCRGGRIDVEIPTLEAFLGWAASRPELVVVFLDVKIPAERAALLPKLLARLDRAIAEHAPRFRVVLETAHPAVVTELRRLAPRYDCALDVEPPPGFLVDTSAASAASAAIRHGLRLVMPQKPRGTTFRPFATHRRIVEADLRRAREHNERNASPPVDAVCSFTINERDQMRDLVALGVTGIQSDRPALLREVAIALGRDVSTPRR